MYMFRQISTFAGPAYCLLVNMIVVLTNFTIYHIKWNVLYYMTYYETCIIVNLKRSVKMIAPQM